MLHMKEMRKMMSKHGMISPTMIRKHMMHDAMLEKEQSKKKRNKKGGKK